MCKYQDCLGALECVSDNIRDWNRYIAPISEAYIELSDGQRSKLRKAVPAADRFNLMHQYFGHFRRMFKESGDTDFLEMVERSLLLLSLENFDYDYRETTLRFEKFLERAYSRPRLFEQAWADLKGKMPKRAIDIVDRKWRNVSCKS